MGREKEETLILDDVVELPEDQDDLVEETGEFARTVEADAVVRDAPTSPVMSSLGAETRQFDVPDELLDRTRGAKGELEWIEFRAELSPDGTLKVPEVVRARLAAPQGRVRLVVRVTPEPQD